MSVSRWNYDPERCDGNYCVGDCWLCYNNRDYDGDMDDPDDGRFGLDEEEH